MSLAGFESFEADPDVPVRRPAALRILFWFWGVVLIAAIAGAITLQALGPPPSRATAGLTERAGPRFVPPEQVTTLRSPTLAIPDLSAQQDASHAPAEAKPTAFRPTGTPILAPDPDLMVASASDPRAMLPRIGADGRTPMAAYAAGFDETDPRPRIAILLGGIGQSDTDADEALRQLPAPISFAVSPYALRPEHMLAEIRAAGHEMLIGLPMEPQGYPINDEGNQALLTGSSTEENLQRLDWALSRIAGYVGATNALDGLRGERYSAASTQMHPVLQQLAERGLLYVDASPALSRLPLGTAGLAHLATRGVDIVIDEPAVRSEIDIKLLQLEQLAHDRGSAIGLASLPRPVTLDRLAAWAATLGQHGFVLAPVSVVVNMPPSATPAPSVRPNLIR